MKLQLRKTKATQANNLFLKNIYIKSIHKKRNYSHQQGIVTLPKRALPVPNRPAKVGSNLMKNDTIYVGGT